MRLLEPDGLGGFRLTEDLPNNKTPRYAILSHVWGPEEVNFQDVTNGTGKNKAGYAKLQFCGNQARRDGLTHFWVDTCCIDKTNSTELQTAINSMFRWYRDSAKCYVYLDDIDVSDTDAHDEARWEPLFRAHKWFTRGWTLQELIAPTTVEFYTTQGHYLGDRLSLESQIQEATGIATSALRGADLAEFDIDERFGWAETRQTTYEEDWAYSLLGIFGIFMPLIYGEGRLHAIRRLKQEIASLSRGDTTKTPPERRTVLNWITQVEYGRQQSDNISRRQPGTGTWLLESSKFRSWVEREKQTLFCHGIPGTGKTILAATVVAELSNRFNDGKTGIGYIYFNFRRQHEQSVRDQVASLLRQLAQSWPGPSLPDHVQTLYNKHEERGTRPPLDELSQTLQLVARSYSRVFFVIDALDECQSPASRAAFLAHVFALQAVCGANILATSRALPNIISHFDENAHLEIRASDGDVQRLVDGFIPRLPTFVARAPALINEIKVGIAKAADGSFLLAHLHLDSLVGKITPKAIKVALERLPLSSQAYDYAFGSAIERIEAQVPDQRDLAKQVITWIVRAKRPLAGEELQHALAVEPGEPELDLDNLPQIEDMVAVCAGLVTVDQDSDIIRLVHYTAQEYFERTRRYILPESRLAVTCLSYLLFREFARGPHRLPKAIDRRVDGHPFLFYAARYWGHHVRPSEDDPEVWRLLFAFFNSPAMGSASQVLRYTTGYRKAYWSYEESLSITPLCFAARCGLEKAFTALLASGMYSPDEATAMGSTPLITASSGGHVSIVEKLLNLGANPYLCNWYGNALGCAVESGQSDVIRVLVRHGMDPNGDAGHGKAPIRCALDHDHVAAVQTLVELGANPNPVDFKGEAFAHLAAVCGRTGILNLLLEKGWTTLENKFNERTMLLRAVDAGQEAVVRLLLDRGADVHAVDDDGCTALDLALEKDHKAIAELLHARGARESRRPAPLTSPASPASQVLSRDDVGETPPMASLGANPPL